MGAPKVFAAVIAAATLLWVTFNVGMDYGIDTASCVVLATTKVEPTGHNPFCDRAQPSAAPVKRALRISWLAVRRERVRDDR